MIIDLQLRNERVQLQMRNIEKSWPQVIRVCLRGSHQIYASHDRVQDLHTGYRVVYFGCPGNMAGFRTIVSTLKLYVRTDWSGLYSHMEKHDFGRKSSHLLVCNTLAHSRLVRDSAGGEISKTDHRQKASKQQTISLDCHLQMQYIRVEDSHQSNPASSAVGCLSR